MFGDSSYFVDDQNFYRNIAHIVFFKAITLHSLFPINMLVARAIFLSHHCHHHKRVTVPRKSGLQPKNKDTEEKEVPAEYNKSTVNTQ